MKRLIILLVIAMLVSATPAQAATPQLFAGVTGGLWGPFWTDAGSSVMASTLDGTFRRTQDITYLVKCTAGNVFVDGGPRLSLDFWPQTWKEVQHIYYYIEIQNVGAPGTWNTSLGGTFPGYIKGELNAYLNGVNQHWGVNIDFSNFPNPHPLAGVEYIIYARFSLDPITSITFPSVVNKTGRITESARGSNLGGVVNQNSLFVGDSKTRQGIRSVVQFNTAGLPDNAIITGATIHMVLNVANTVGNTVGWGPATYPNSIAVKIANPCIGTCYLTSSDWQAVLPTVGYMGPVWSNSYVAVQNFSFSNYAKNINRKGVTEFRFQWQKKADTDLFPDRIAFRSAGGDDPPTITVYFRLP